MTTLSPDQERHFILNAFRPGVAINTPGKFAGRRETIEELTNALHVDGTCPVIYGERGLGKTSIAHQIERIAVGDLELLHHLGLDKLALHEDHRFVSFYLACTDDIRTKDDLLQRLVNIGEGFTSESQLPQFEKTAQSTRKKIKLKIYESEVRESYVARSRLQDFIRFSIEEKLLAILEQATKHEGRKVLVVIDEFDRVADKNGLASFIKSASSEAIKFMIVGVAHDLSSLIADHQSLDRLLSPVQVDIMSDEELDKIIKLVENSLQDAGVPITFAPLTRRLIVEYAGGLPWFVHMLGHESLRRSYDSSEASVTPAHLEAVVAHLADSRYARQFEDLYIKVVGDSPPREIVLRSFAKWRGRDIPTSELYKVIHRLGVGNPSAYVKELLQVRCGKVLSRAPFRPTGGTYSFSNVIFKRYVNLRHSEYKGAKEKVDAAWAK